MTCESTLKFLPAELTKSKYSTTVIPIILAFIYGLMVFQATIFTTIFFNHHGVWESLLTVGIILAVFATVCLWPVLIRFGNGVTISNLRMTLKNSENEVRALQDSKTKLSSNLKEYEKELSRSHSYFRHLMKTFNMATFHSDMNHQIQWAYNLRSNDANIIGMKITDIIQSEAGVDLALLMQNAIDDGEIHGGEIELKVKNEMRQYMLQVAPRYGKDGSLVGTMCVSNDVTERAQWHQHLAAMTMEVNHRARNLLAIVVSVLGQSAKSVASVSEYKEKILTRVSSLAKSIDLITEDSWTASSLRKLVAVQIEHVAPEDKHKIHIDGSDLGLKSKAIQNVGLAIHELSTNSKKFGALSKPDGNVTLSWSIIDRGSDKCLHICWEESFLTDNLARIDKGFGVKILERIVAQELGGQSFWELQESGLKFEMFIPTEWLETQMSI